MAGRASIVWFAIMVAAIFNGAARDLLMAPRLGDPIARAVSCITLAGAIVLVAWVSIGWMRPSSQLDAWTIGAFWLGMTLAFEFLAGHYVFGTPWPTLLADYNLLSGRLWILVLIATLIAPAIAFRLAHNPGRTTEISPRPADAARLP
jgi:hypothetical protein